VSLILFLIIVWTLVSQVPFFKNLKDRLLDWVLPRRSSKSAAVREE